MMDSLQIQQVTGRAIPLRGSDIDTDRIIPARYLRCVSFDGLGEHAFEDDRAQDPNHPFNQERFQGAKILIAGRNFGCGSSREHAPQSLAKWGIEAIVAESFAEIFIGNCCAIGIPCVTVDTTALGQLWEMAEADPQRGFTVDVEKRQVQDDGTSVDAGIPDGMRRAFLEGSWNATMTLLQAEKDIDATATSLPYVDGFAA